MSLCAAARRPAHLTLLTLAILLAAVSSAVADAITVTWEPSTDASVVGYRVYVGAQPGHYDAAYDVGPRTQFIYPADNLRPYYFAVAAYAPGPLVGTLSPEVVAYPNIGVVGSSSGAGALQDWSLASSSMETANSPSVAKGTCLSSGIGACFTVAAVIQGLTNVSAMAGLPDGRLLVVEGRRTIRVVENGRLLPSAAFEAPGPGVELTGIAVDPAFSKTGFVFITMLEHHTNGHTQLSILRLRTVANQLSQGAVVVTGLQTSGTMTPPALDGLGHLYLAIPSGRVDGVSPSSGHILRFNVDGTVPRDNRAGSPVFARGPALPIALSWEPERSRLVVLNREPGAIRGLLAIDRMGESGGSFVSTTIADTKGALEVGGPVDPQGTLVKPAGDAGTMAWIADGGYLKSMELLDDKISPGDSLDFNAVGVPEAVAAGPGSTLFIALRSHRLSERTASILQVITPSPGVARGPGLASRELQ